MILSCLIFDVINNKRPFDLVLNRKLLAKYKTRNPENRMGSLERNPRPPS